MTETEVPEKLKRERAGTYVTADGRFTVEQTSSGWVVLDSEQANELGLPLTRGPYDTLDAARGAIAEARTGAAPKGQIVSISSRSRKSGPTPTGRTEATRDGGHSESRSHAKDGEDAADGGHSGRRRAREDRDEPGKRGSSRRAETARSAKPKVVIRELRTVDGDQLRALWAECGFRSIGDDDLSLARLARRNPGLLLVASEGTRVVGSALGAWDGRRGWIYHVATADSHRRQGIATKLVEQVEAGLRDLGCPKVSVLVRDENDDGREFWTDRGYEMGSRQFARELRED
jgi:ribosomal protein S18 acetylase RimI-like enzyme